LTPSNRPVYTVYSRYSDFSLQRASSLPAAGRSFRAQPISQFSGRQLEFLKSQI
jgi:hypothetical protein